MSMVGIKKREENLRRSTARKKNRKRTLSDREGKRRQVLLKNRDAKWGSGYVPDRVKDLPKIGGSSGIVKGGAGGGGHT